MSPLIDPMDRSSDDEENSSQKTIEPSKRRRFCKYSTVILCLAIVLSATAHVISSMKRDEAAESVYNAMLARANELQKQFSSDFPLKYSTRAPPPQCANVPRDRRFDCHPEDGADELSCTDRRCCWNPPNGAFAKKSSGPPLNVPYCYYPPNWNLYEEFNSTDKDTILFKNCASSAYKKDVRLIQINRHWINKDIQRVRIVDAEKKRYEPHLPIIEHLPKSIEDPKYWSETVPDFPGFRIKRARDNATILDGISGGGFIFADQFLQTSFLLPKGSNVYGLGEHRNRLNLKTDWRSLTMFNKDQPPTENANLYGSHPFALIMTSPGEYVGLLFLNGNAMDIILQPTPAITFRSIGGVFDFFFLSGPTPSAVVKQYSEIVGKPFMPPYWSLGFHLCKYGYGSLEGTKRVWNRTRAAGIPFDTQWNDLDYMSKNSDFTYDKNKFGKLPEFVDELHKAGMHYIPLIDPGISGAEASGSYRPYDEGMRRNIFVKEARSDLPFEGKVWTGNSTVWPDFTNPESLEYWHDMMNDMWHMFPYDGAWIDMNEPSNFYDGHANGCETNELDDPIYVPNVIGNRLATKTLCMNARHYLGSHYDVHNTYGISEAVATNRALVKIRRARPFVISRSTWLGFGSYAGHWSGDIYSSWHDMRMTVPQLLSFSLFQIPMMGADICGFNGNTTEALCNRWSQLGAFYPFSRNHNSDENIDQDPVAMGELVVKSARKALMIRYRFLPYLYTLFFRAHMFGETVARPLFFEFPKDSTTWDEDSQFLWGSALMIVPVLEEGTNKVNAYLPSGCWYDFYNKSSIVSSGQNYTLEAPLDTIPLFVRAGSILPGQTPGKTTTESRKNDFELLIAPDEQGSAEGQLYWDDGDSLRNVNQLISRRSIDSQIIVDSIADKNYRWLEFTLKNRTLQSRQIEAGNYRGKMVLGKVAVMGVAEPVSQVTINGKVAQFQYVKEQSYLIVRNLGVDLTVDFLLSWK